MARRSINPWLDFHTTPDVSGILNPYISYPTGGGAFVPTDIAGCQIWLDGSDASTLWDATTGGSPVAPDGSVARWDDKSGLANHAVQPTGGNQPVRKTSIQNSKDILRFTTKYMSLTTGITSVAPFTCFFVWKKTSSGSKLWGFTGASAATGFPVDYSDSTLYLFPNTRNFRTTPGSNAWHILSLKSLLLSEAAWRDGTALTLSTGVGLGANIDFGVIGARLSDGETSDGDYAEIILYNSDLSDANRDAVEAYLGAKWGITVA